MAKHTKGRALHSRPFAQLCAEMDAERTISSHADVRRLSAGGPLARGLSRTAVEEKQGLHKVSLLYEYKTYTLNMPPLYLMLHGPLGNIV